MCGIDLLAGIYINVKHKHSCSHLKQLGLLHPQAFFFFWGFGQRSIGEDLLRLYVTIFFCLSSRACRRTDKQKKDFHFYPPALRQRIFFQLLMWRRWKRELYDFPILEDISERCVRHAPRRRKCVVQLLKALLCLHWQRYFAVLIFFSLFNFLMNS